MGTPALWIGFLAFVMGMLALDLGVFHRDAHVITFREALAWSMTWIAISCVFGGVVYAGVGPVAALEFYTGYVIEKSLAIDNIFVFVGVFSSFHVPAAIQHRVLFWGVFGALILRAVLIVLGAALVERFHWILYVFGGFLLLTGLQMLRRKGASTSVEENRLVRWLEARLPTTTGYRGDRFFVRENGRRLATPLFLVLVIIEVADIVFAVDSIPAIFAVTRDPFIVFTSNILALLGLRSMYFLLADLVPRFVHLKTGLSLVLVYVGAKMLLLDVVEVPIVASLAVVVTLVAGSIAASMVATARR